MNDNILLVDDESNVTQALKQVLHKERFHVLTAHSGLEALKILREHPVEAVVSDEKMPGMTGTLLLTVIRRDYPDTVRIMLTGHASLEVAVRAINNGEIYRFLMKPCHGAELAIVIRQALQHKNLIKESRKLLQWSRRQGEFLAQIEALYPGIDRVQRDTAGSIIIDDPEKSVEDLIQEIRAELHGIDADTTS